MKSVAYVTTAFPTTAFFVESDVHRLLARGVRLEVFALRSPRGRSWQPEHEPLVRVTRWIGSPLDPRSWGALLLWLVRRPHVLIGETCRMLWASRRSAYALAGHLGYLPAAARIAWRVERGDYERVHGAWAHFPGSVAYLVSRLTGRPFSLSAHAGSDLYRTQAFLADKVRAASFTAACVRGNAEMLRALAGDGAEVHCVYHGVDRRRFDGAGRRLDAEPLLLGVGRLSPAKGFDLAVLALGALGRRGLRARLVLVGDGPERARLERLAHEQGVTDRVTFAGALPQREVVDLYRRAWALLAPSRVLANGRRDGIPNVVVEAMAMGVPVIGTRAAGLEEAITHGQTGLLAAAEDAAGIAEAIARLIADPTAVDRLGANARALVAATFDAEVNFDRFFALLASNGRAGRMGEAEPAREARAG